MKRCTLMLVTGMLTMACLAVTARAEDTKNWMAFADDVKKSADANAAQTQAKSETTVAKGEEAPPEWSKPIPLSFSLGYTMVSDYVFRGVNYSEFQGEGREGLNHQLSAGTELDLARGGAFGFTTWFEFYAFQENSNFSETSHNNLQEVDYTLYYKYDLSKLNEKIPLVVETGWIFYTFNQAKGDAYLTQEWYAKLSLNDASLFGAEDNVLNPYVAYYMDVDDYQGSWIEIGVSHDFALSKLGCKDTPFLKDITITPSAVLGIDHRYYTASNDDGDSLLGKGTRLANIVYGLAVKYDLGSALNIPAKYGKYGVAGFVNYSQPLADGLRETVMDDEFYGGLSLTFGW